MTAREASGVDAMVAVYRHDVHKARMRGHEEADEVWAGVRVNESVPRGADDDAALMSRPDGEPVQSVDNHASPFRVSLLTGESGASSNPVSGSIGGALGELLQHTDPVEMHAAWLSSGVVEAFNESVFYPYTSLKYHTLLAGALLDNYRAGSEFTDLFLVVDDPGVVVPHRTVLSTSTVSLRVTNDPGDRPHARLGAAPAMSFADVYARLSGQAFPVDADRAWRVLDAQLRRIRSWSTALQFIPEYEAWVDYRDGRSNERGGGR